MYFINTSSRAEDVRAFFEEGAVQARLLLEPAFRRLGFDPSGRRILEIGCGIGRLFPGFLRLGFADVWGIDVSLEMVRRATEFCPVKSARFLLGNGTDLRGVSDGAIDYCFSFTVFQHVPDMRIVDSYLSEVTRVLGEGGRVPAPLRRPTAVRRTPLVETGP